MIKCQLLNNNILKNNIIQYKILNKHINSNRNRIITKAKLEALVFDCDGVIIESEELHRISYNKAFKHFDLTIQGNEVNWTESFYEDLQNKIGGGKPKMRWYFGKYGWPRSNITNDDKIPSNENEQTEIIDIIQDWKSEAYRDLVSSGDIKPRPGILRLILEARYAGLKIAVCSAATKESVISALRGVLGPEIYRSLHCFLAGDDVKEKKPSPLIYQMASERLFIAPENCLVIEDSAIGVTAALKAGMKCLVTYTNSTKSQAFDGASLIVPNLEEPAPVTVDTLKSLF